MVSWESAPLLGSLVALVLTLAAEALRGNREDFFKLADRDQTERKQALDTMLRPLQDSLEKLQSRTVEMERARENAYGNLTEQLRQLAILELDVQHRANDLDHLADMFFGHRLQLLLDSLSSPRRPRSR